MWIPHRVFFANLAFVIAVTAGILLLAVGPRGWRGWVLSVVVPPLALGGFIGLTATRGMLLHWQERVGIGLWVASMVAVWLLGAAIPMGIVRRRGAPWQVQAVVGGIAAMILFATTRVMLGR
jgi:hypothetical protein